MYVEEKEEEAFIHFRNRMIFFFLKRGWKVWKRYYVFIHAMYVMYASLLTYAMYAKGGKLCVCMYVCI